MPIKNRCIKLSSACSIKFASAFFSTKLLVMSLKSRFSHSWCFTDNEMQRCSKGNSGLLRKRRLLDNSHVRGWWHKILRTDGHSQLLCFPSTPARHKQHWGSTPRLETWKAGLEPQQTLDIRGDGAPRRRHWGRTVRPGRIVIFHDASSFSMTRPNLH
jgi:hypothetical protein